MFSSQRCPWAGRDPLRLCLPVLLGEQALGSFHTAWLRCLRGRSLVQRGEPRLSAETEAFPRRLPALLAFSGGLGRGRLHGAPIGTALRVRVVARALHGGHVAAVPHAGPAQLTQVVQAAGDAGQEAELVQQAPRLRERTGRGGWRRLPNAFLERVSPAAQGPVSVPALPSVPSDSAPGWDAPALRRPRGVALRPPPSPLARPWTALCPLPTHATAGLCVAPASPRRPRQASHLGHCRRRPGSGEWSAASRPLR